MTLQTFGVLMLALTCLYEFRECQVLSRCSSDRRCSCHNDAGEIFANCSGLRLSNSIPKFKKNVTGVDLSRNQITEVPLHLPLRIKYLDLSENNLKGISGISLTKYQSLTNLSFNYCNLKFIEEGSLKNLNNLTYLSICDNKELSLSVVKNISFDLRFSKLKTLRMNRVQCASGSTIMLSKSHVQYMRNMSLQEVHLAGNRIGTIEFGLLSMLPKTITYIDVSNNYWVPGWYLFELSSLKSLKVIKMGIDRHNSIFPFDPCNDCKNETGICTSTFGNTKHNLLHRNITFYLPPSLEKISAEGFNQRLTLIMRNIFIINSRNKIRHLDLRDNRLSDLMEVKGLHHINVLDISSNFCVHLPLTFFDEMTQIRNLNISNNLLSDVLEKLEIFRHLRYLKFLDLSNNFISNLHKSLFRNLHSLQNLSLHNNKLQKINADMSDLQCLTMLDLSKNRIQYLEKETLHTLDVISRKSKLKINLQDNILSCTCQSLHFLKWIDRSTTIEFVARNQYSCRYLNGSVTFLQNLPNVIKTLEMECTAFTALIVVNISVILIFVTITLCGIIYRYRWKIRYLYYVAKRNYGQGKYADCTENDKLHQYHFDAFISYANEDRLLILPHLLHMEKSNNLTFCIHSRDFIPGTTIAENITNAIHNSKRTVCFLSTSYMKSEWCKYEMNMARMESIYSRAGESVILLVLMEDHIIQDIPMTLMDVLESKTYLEYRNEKEENILFWRKLIECMLDND